MNAVASTGPLLDVADLAVRFDTDHGEVEAVRGVSFQLDAGGSLALLGESGSGKTAIARALMGILDDNATTLGSAVYDGTQLVGLGETAFQRLRGTEIAMVFQDAQSALNPAYTVGWQIAEVFRKRAGLRRSAAKKRAVEALESVGIPDAARRAGQYPHQFSGGMRQRVLIAIALALEPRILIADEPTTALDATIQSQILALIRRVHQETGSALILISHDLGVVAEMADQVLVLKDGAVVEAGATEDIYLRPEHEYTKTLLAASPAFQAAGVES
ncbi:ABC transporter ATP-binding protein [Agromyces aerolatus]|uniref:ABC transporter ATP-binding protein n=1 Tax=Agromyces sp. LY-1074 TaxID=3074080 RepID=UPI002860306E|nr:MULTISPECIES: ABC transporter ATP-binding protein [unclassified Agromyces]MDR5700857.1 ABC transporter ATP-binding protein [Agromyces sp. LY-1074]MDR5707482.1 ABC transporter ATP-binding protein [Agromyces sp. LY-1358]